MDSGIDDYGRTYLEFISNQKMISRHRKSIILLRRDCHPHDYQPNPPKARHRTKSTDQLHVISPQIVGNGRGGVTWHEDILASLCPFSLHSQTHPSASPSLRFSLPLPFPFLPGPILSRESEGLFHDKLIQDSSRPSSNATISLSAHPLAPQSPSSSSSETA